MGYVPLDVVRIEECQREVDRRALISSEISGGTNENMIHSNDLRY